MQASSFENELRGKAERTSFSPRVILFGTDFSAACSSAWSYALAIAGEYGSKLLLAHVIDPTVFAAVPAELVNSAREQVRNESKQHLEHLQQSHAAPQFEIETLLSEGETAETLLRILHEHQADLLIAGTRGHTRMERLLLGSVAEKLFRQAPCPALIVPEQASFGKKLLIRRILCPIDFSADSPTAVAYASSIARHYGAQLILMHVLAEGAADPERSELIVNAENRLRKLVDRDQDLPATDVEVVFGTPAARISRTAVEFQADLIVLSVHAAAATAAHERERNAYKTIRWSPCPVLTIPRSWNSTAGSTPLAEA